MSEGLEYEYGCVCTCGCKFTVCECKTVLNLGDGQAGLEVISQARGKKQSSQDWEKRP